MSDTKRPYEAPQVEEIETGGTPIETSPGLSEPPA